MSAYDRKKVEELTQLIWDSNDSFSYVENAGKTFSMFLTPPNASGPIHVGNALMVAIQDVLARYYRAKKHNVVWVPGIDHGGYETQITYERERMVTDSSYVSNEQDPRELYVAIKKAVEENRDVIIDQLKSLGASVDWHQLRYTLDEQSVISTHAMFSRMVSDGCVLRQPYMMNFCPVCSTSLADIELKKETQVTESHLIRCVGGEDDEEIVLSTTAPEFLFSVHNVLVHPEDKRYRNLIGKSFTNPISGEEITVVKSKRKLAWHQEREHLEPFLPSAVRFDYEYAVRYDLPYDDIFDWSGLLTKGYPELGLRDARQQAVTQLQDGGYIVSQAEGEEELAYCKKGHLVSSMIRLTWFVDFDAGRTPMRQQALDLMEQERLMVYPAWRKKGLVDWIGKMYDWPIARQNVWGIRMPVWYEIEDPSDFLVWFFDQDGKRVHGNLAELLAHGYDWDEVVAGLQRVYAPADCKWTAEPEEGVRYLPETDTLDTWFTSGAWSVFAFEHLSNFDQVYPSDTVVIGTDLLRLSIARKIVLSVYLTGKLPFRSVYFHPLLNASDGRKMSKSLGNVTSLESYLEEYGADVTRMALLSYMTSGDDFVLEDSRLAYYRQVAGRVWELYKAYTTIIASEKVTRRERSSLLLSKTESLSQSVASDIERHLFAKAQERTVSFIEVLENHLWEGVNNKNVTQASAEFLPAFDAYLSILHPFMPHLTEAIFSQLYPGKVLANTAWPTEGAKPSRPRRPWRRSNRRHN